MSENEEVLPDSGDETVQAEEQSPTFIEVAASEPGIAFAVVDPLGRTITCDEDTLNMKAGKHGERFVSASTAKELFEKPVLIAKSQNAWQSNSSMYFRPYENADRSAVKWIRGTVRFDSSGGVTTSIHPRGEIGLTGDIEYMNYRTDTSDGD